MAQGFFGIGTGVDAAQDDRYAFLPIAGPNPVGILRGVHIDVDAHKVRCVFKRQWCEVFVCNGHMVLRGCECRHNDKRPGRGQHAFQFRIHGA